jgi:hypothetical protein
MVIYADRGEVSINNTPLIDVKSISLRIIQNSRAVPTMTPDRKNRGIVQGQYDYDISCQTAVRKNQASPKLEFIDWGSVDGQLTAVFGADQYTCLGLFLPDSEQAASAPGEDVGKTFNFKCLNVVDNVGNSALFSFTA